MSVSTTAYGLPLLMLPGTLCDGRVFGPLVDRLRLSPTIVRTAGATSAPAMARLVLERAPERFALCGFSLGAIVALEMVAQAPHRIGRLVLMGANARVMTDAVAEARREAVLIAEDEGCESYIDSVWDNSVPRSRAHDTVLRGLLHDMAATTPLQAFREQIEISVNREDSRPRLGAVRCPALMLCGAEDRVCPPDLSREIAASIPGSRLAIIEGAGHYVMLDRPDHVAHEMRAFLAVPATNEFSKETS